IVQGLAAGVGFVGGGTILKHGEHVEGLTTAASLWLTAAVGSAAGIGSGVTAVVTTILALVILGVLGWLEVAGGGEPETDGSGAPGAGPPVMSPRAIRGGSPGPATRPDAQG